MWYLNPTNEYIEHERDNAKANERWTYRNSEAIPPLLFAQETKSNMYLDVLESYSFPHLEGSATVIFPQVAHTPLFW
jgi:hypothetical protein